MLLSSKTERGKMVLVNNYMIMIWLSALFVGKISSMQEPEKPNLVRSAMAAIDIHTQDGYQSMIKYINDTATSKQISPDQIFAAIIENQRYDIFIREIWKIFKTSHDTDDLKNFFSHFKHRRLKLHIFLRLINSNFEIDTNMPLDGFGELYNLIIDLLKGCDIKLNCKFYKLISGLKKKIMKRHLSDKGKFKDLVKPDGYYSLFCKLQKDVYDTILSKSENDQNIEKIDFFNVEKIAEDFLIKFKKIKQNTNTRYEDPENAIEFANRIVIKSEVLQYLFLNFFVRDMESAAVFNCPKKLDQLISVLCNECLLPMDYLEFDELQNRIEILSPVCDLLREMFPSAWRLNQEISNSYFLGPRGKSLCYIINQIIKSIALSIIRTMKTKKPHRVKNLFAYVLNNFGLPMLLRTIKLILRILNDCIPLEQDQKLCAVFLKRAISGLFSKMQTGRLIMINSKFDKYFGLT